MNPTIEQLIAAGMSEEIANRVLTALAQEDTGAQVDPQATSEGTADPQAESEGTEAALQAGSDGASATSATEDPDNESAELAETADEAEAAAARGADGEVSAADSGEAAQEDAPAAVNTPDYAAENQRLRAALADALVGQAALRLGVRPERIGTLKKLVDLAGIDPNGDDVAGKIEQAVKEALKEVPELAASALGSLGAHAREGANPIDPFTRGFSGR